MLYLLSIKLKVSIALLILQMLINFIVTPNIINFLSKMNIFDDVYLGVFFLFVCFFTIVHSDAKETFVKLNWSFVFIDWEAKERIQIK